MKTIKQFLTLENSIKLVVVTFIAITLIGFIIELFNNPNHLVFGSF